MVVGGGGRRGVLGEVGWAFCEGGGREREREEEELGFYDSEGKLRVHNKHQTQR